MTRQIFFIFVLCSATSVTFVCITRCFQNTHTHPYNTVCMHARCASCLLQFAHVTHFSTNCLLGPVAIATSWSYDGYSLFELSLFFSPPLSSSSSSSSFLLLLSTFLPPFFSAVVNESLNLRCSSIIRPSQQTQHAVGSPAGGFVAPGVWWSTNTMVITPWKLCSANPMSPASCQSLDSGVGLLTLKLHGYNTGLILKVKTQKYWDRH